MRLKRKFIRGYIVKNWPVFFIFCLQKLIIDKLSVVEPGELVPCPLWGQRTNRYVERFKIRIAIDMI